MIRGGIILVRLQQKIVTKKLDEICDILNLLLRVINQNHPRSLPQGSKAADPFLSGILYYRLVSVL